MTEIMVNKLGSHMFKTSEEAYSFTARLSEQIGLPVLYGPARLALALSLSDKSKPERVKTKSKKGLRGKQILGESELLFSWITIITEYYGHQLTNDDFTSAISDHWARGSKTLHEIWKRSDYKFENFIINLASKSGISQPKPNTPSLGGLPASEQVSGKKVMLQLGKFTSSNSDAEWHINQQGHSPHMAVMGASGTGKTRLSCKLVESLRAQTNCSLLFFDFKGDIQTRFSDDESVGILDGSKITIPLDIFWLPEKTKPEILAAASELCDSIRTFSKRDGGPIQIERLRKVAVELLSSKEKVTINHLLYALKTKYEEEGKNIDSVLVTLEQICEYGFFEPKLSPKEFFSKNWVIQLKDSSSDFKRFISLTVLSAMNRFLNSLVDAPTDAQGDNRQITTLLAIDEAHEILGLNHPSLNNIIRLSRSKGGAVILISQSPSDYKQSDINFLENMGLTICFQTSATQSDVNKVFATRVSPRDLETGECVVQFAGKKGVPKIRVF